MVTDIQILIRKLAKNDYYQTLFSLGKEWHNINLFENKSDFTEIQLLFLRYLNFYSQLYLDIALNDVRDVVLENMIYEDSYMFYKTKKTKQEQSHESPTNKVQPLSKTRWLFKKSPSERL